MRPERDSAAALAGDAAPGSTGEASERKAYHGNSYTVLFIKESGERVAFAVRPTRSEADWIKAKLGAWGMLAEVVPALPGEVAGSTRVAAARQIDAAAPDA